MKRRSTVTPLVLLSLFVFMWCNTIDTIKVVSAASGKNDKVTEQRPEEDDFDDREWETALPTSAPIVLNMDGNDNGNANDNDNGDGDVNGNGNDNDNGNNGRFTMSPIAPPNQGPNSDTATTNAPAMAPIIPQENADSATEDLDEDETTANNDEDTAMQQEMKESCRAVARGIAFPTNTSLQVTYNFEIFTSTATPLYTGIAVNNAVTNYLMNQYIRPHCNNNNNNNTTTNNNNNRNIRQRRHQRSLQTSNSTPATSSSIKFGAGDVRGVARGTTTVVNDATCIVPVEDTGMVACYQLQTSNTIHFRNDYSIATDDNGAPIIDDIESKLLSDITTAFTTNRIETNVVAGGEIGLQSTNYVSGTAGEIVVMGEPKERSRSSSESDRSSNSRGLTRPGKAFLTLFILCFIGVMLYFGYKYGYPKLKEQYPNIHERLTTRARHGTNTASNTDRSFRAERTNPFVAVYERFQRNTASNTDRSFRAERTNPFVAVYERFQRKVPKEVHRPYDFIMSDSKLDRINDRNVLISDTIESSSTDGGFGTEMILEDLQEEAVRLSPAATTSSPSSFNDDYRFTPNTLPNTKEYAKTDGTRLNFDRALMDNDDDESYTTNNMQNHPNRSDNNNHNNNSNNKNDDAFSFSDVNIIIDDSSSYASTIPPNFSPANPPNIRRPYSAPDTVNL